MHRIRLLQARRYRTNGKTEKAQEVSAVRQAKHGWIITLLFAVLSILWISPIFMVLLNSFKRKAYIFKHPFGISTVSITEGLKPSRMVCQGFSVAH